MPRKFTDHFAPVAPNYAAFRPQYPDELFHWLGSIAPSRTLAWDCATGNGQAAAGLAKVFDKVIATDASSAQIAAAASHPKVVYRVAAAEESGLTTASVDLITVAQALHWFDLSRFYPEVRRVLVPGGILVAWTYGMVETGSTEIDRLLGTLYTATLGPYWPPERKFVETGYRTLPFPFSELSPGKFTMELSWTLDEILGFLRTWSAVIRFIEDKRSDPVEPLAKELMRLWGVRRVVRWPLVIRAGRND